MALSIWLYSISGWDRTSKMTLSEVKKVQQQNTFSQIFIHFILGIYFKRKSCFWGLLAQNVDIMLKCAPEKKGWIEIHFNCFPALLSFLLPLFFSDAALSDLETQLHSAISQMWLQRFHTTLAGNCCSTWVKLWLFLYSCSPSCLLPHP